MKNSAILSDEELIIFCKEVHLILNSSMGISDAMESVVEGMENENAKKMLKPSIDALVDNMSLSYALEQSKLFSPYMISMIKIGETTGKTDKIMLSLADYYEKELRLKNQIKSGITYPVVIATMVTVIIGVMVTKVLPIFAEVFKNLGGNLSASVNIVSGAGRVTAITIGVLFIAVVVFAGFLLLLYESPEKREKAIEIITKVPFVRDIYLKYQTAKFANSLSLLVASGNDLHESLKLTEKVVEDKKFKDKILSAVDKLEQGEPLHKTLDEMSIFKGIHSRILKLSVQTGHIDTVLSDLSEEYTREVDISIGNLIGIIEPTLVGATAFIIGAILLAVMLPLLEIMSSIG